MLVSEDHYHQPTLSPIPVSAARFLPLESLLLCHLDLRGEAPVQARVKVCSNRPSAILEIGWRRRLQNCNPLHLMLSRGAFER